MSELTEQFNEFMRRMWVANCVERESYNEKNLSQQEYVEQNEAYLEDVYYCSLADNMVWSKEKVDYVTR
jgi:hypothetical protein|tara:strand:+ start:676 stop:882 length:207 start_codon:yes stop_codon:yes gene_type:complete